MLIKRIKATNYKTYLDLDVDISVQPDRPIILIGGANGGGKTTFFESIYGALYGLKISNKQKFREFLNADLTELQKGEILIKDTTAIALGMGKKFKKMKITHLI